MSVKQARVKVTGRVQGVFFRANTLEMARSLGLSGWVKNNLDGSVSALFQGDDGLVERAILWCHDGPPSSHVTDVKVEYDEVTEELRSFSVTY
ncbi:acylphosphatase [Thermodesulfobacteriota bacterium]